MCVSNWDMFHTQNIGLDSSSYISLLFSGREQQGNTDGISFDFAQSGGMASAIKSRHFRRSQFSAGNINAGVLNLDRAAEKLGTDPR